MSEEVDIALLKAGLAQALVRIEELERELNDLTAKSNKVVGGILVLIALGSIFGFAVTMSEKVFRWFH